MLIERKFFWDLAEILAGFFAVCHLKKIGVYYGFIIKQSETLYIVVNARN